MEQLLIILISLFISGKINIKAFTFGFEFVMSIAARP